MTPTITTVTRDFLTLTTEDQSRFRDVIDLLQGAITLEDTEEVAELVEPAPKPQRERIPARPKARKPEQYTASPEMVKRLKSVLDATWTTRSAVAQRMKASKATVFRAECTAIRQGLIEAQTVGGTRMLRIAIERRPTPETEETPE